MLYWTIYRNLPRPIYSSLWVSWGNSNLRWTVETHYVLSLCSFSLCSIIVCSNSLVHIFLIHLKPIESDVVFERTFGDTAETLDTKDMRLGWTSRRHYNYLQNRSIRVVCMSWTWACHKLQLKFIPWSIHFQQSSSKNPYLSWLYFMVRDSNHAIS